jgi:Putative MetA-pathway of phenol degradation
MVRQTVLFWLICLAPVTSRSQELEPRAYAALPKNLNVAALGYGLSKGSVLTDPSLPVKDLEITTHNIVGSYVHTFGLAKKLARVQFTLPYVFLLGKLQINGRDTSGSRDGFGDARLRLGINLTGSPPLDKKEFTRYTQKTIFGISLVTAIPTGLYFPDKRLNMGNHRWGFKPEAGISKRFNRIYAEAYTGVWFFTANKSFLVDKTLKQEPVFNLQVHASYFFKNRMMVSVNTLWFKGGETFVDSVRQQKPLDNWRLGATGSVPLARHQSLKVQFHVGAFTASGYHYNMASVIYQILF